MEKEYLVGNKPVKVIYDLNGVAQITQETLEGIIDLVNSAYYAGKTEARVEISEEYSAADLSEALEFTFNKGRAAALNDVRARATVVVKDGMLIKAIPIVELDDLMEDDLK